MEAVGEREQQKQNDKSMAQKLQEKHNRLELEQRKRRQLLFEIGCNQRNIPKNALPNASLIYTTLNKQMSLTNDTSNRQVEAIYQPGPNNFWRWFVMFSSDYLKDNFQVKEAELRWTYDNDKTQIYSVRTTGAPRRLLMTLHSSPLIDDDDAVV